MIKEISGTFKLIRNLQPMLDRRDPLSSGRLFMLTAAYYEIRDYEKKFKTADFLQKHKNIQRLTWTRGSSARR